VIARESGSDRVMTENDLDDAANRVIELTNTLGATAADVRQATDTVRIVRELLTKVARRPERLALAGVGMIAAAGVLALRGEHGERGGAEAEPTRPTSR
jgi:hypothetical protein